MLSAAEAAQLALSSKGVSAEDLESAPVPHPQLLRTPAKMPHIGDTTTHSNHIIPPGKHTGEVLEELGLTVSERRKLAADGALGKAAQGAIADHAKL